MDRFPCDDEYLRTLGRALYNFSVLEYAVLWIIETIEPGYMQKYRKEGLSAGQIATQFISSTASVQDTALRVKLSLMAARFQSLKNSRNDLLHANPAAWPSGDSVLIRADNKKQIFITWAPRHVVEIATKFQDLAIELLDVFYAEMGG